MKSITEIESLLESLPEHDRTVERWESELATAKEGVANVSGDDGSMDPHELVKVRREAAERAEVAEINFQRASKAREDALDSIRIGISRIAAGMVDPLREKTHEREAQVREAPTALVGEVAVTKHAREAGLLATRADDVTDLRATAQTMEHMRIHGPHLNSFPQAIKEVKQAAQLLGR